MILTTTETVSLTVGKRGVIPFDKNNRPLLGSSDKSSINLKLFHTEEDAKNYCVKHDVKAAYYLKFDIVCTPVEKFRSSDIQVKKKVVEKKVIKKATPVVKKKKATKQTKSTQKKKVIKKATPVVKKKTTPIVSATNAKSFILAYMARHNINQGEMAELLEVSQASVSNYIKENNTTPRKKILERLNSLKDAEK